MLKYRFFLQLDGGDKIPVNPTYKDDLSLDYELETNQRFYRKKLSGKISFLRNDFDLINDAPFQTQFTLTLQKSKDYGKTFTDYYISEFYKTDCTFNLDDKLVTVQPETIDEYNDVLAGLEKEYNLVLLSPEIQRITLHKRPLIQMYIPGDSIVSCFLGGTYWEQDANVVTDTEALIRTYHFALNSELREIVVTGSANPNATGVYAGKLGSKYSNQNGYYIIGENVQNQNVFSIYRTSDNKLLYRTAAVEKLDPARNLDFRAVSPSSGSLVGNGAKKDIYARYLCDVDKIGDLNTYPLPGDDIVGNNRNYKRGIGYAVQVSYISSWFSNEPTEWGRANNGKYFEPPYSLFISRFYPIARSAWINSSLWFAFDVMDWILEEKARKQYVLRDTFPLSSCIKVLLKQFAPEIKHEATPEYSEFLYSDRNPISYKSFRLFISQKSNIINGEYQTPAQKAPITLAQIMNMLRDVYKCYWYIENGKLKIEQVQWFRNGGSYSTTPVIGTDLTKLENVRNGKKWGFATSEYSFDKVDMAERYQFEWMDDVTEVFEGVPIEVKSKYVTAGKIENISISNFTSDIDLMLLNPGAMSVDGFALFAAEKKGAQYELPIMQQTIDGVDYYLQNGYLAFIYLQPTCWVYDMPARNLEINGSVNYAMSIERKKKQTLSFPVSDDVNPLELVKTYIGNGQIDKLSVNLSSQTAKATLKYDTE